VWSTTSTDSARLRLDGGVANERRQAVEQRRDTPARYRSRVVSDRSVATGSADGRSQHRDTEGGISVLRHTHTHTHTHRLLSLARPQPVVMCCYKQMGTHVTNALVIASSRLARLACSLQLPPVTSSDRPHTCPALYGTSTVGELWPASTTVINSRLDRSSRQNCKFCETHFSVEVRTEQT